MNTPTPPLPSAVVAYLVTNLSSGEPSLCFEDERGDYGDEDHTPVFEGLCRLSDHEASIRAKDAEIAEWRKLLDPAVLHANLVRGVPAKLTREHLLHLLGDDAEIAALKATADEDAHVIERLSTLLAGVAIALKGDELPLHRHSYHDLADVADATKLELELYRAAFPNGIPEETLDAAIDAIKGDANG